MTFAHGAQPKLVETVDVPGKRTNSRRSMGGCQIMRTGLFPHSSDTAVTVSCGLCHTCRRNSSRRSSSAAATLKILGSAIRTNRSSLEPAGDQGVRRHAPGVRRGAGRRVHTPTRRSASSASPGAPPPRRALHHRRRCVRHTIGLRLAPGADGEIAETRVILQPLLAARATQLFGHREGVPGPRLGRAPPPPLC